MNVDKIKYYTNNKDIVVATTRWMGQMLRTEAKCHPNDVFDYEVGKQIATSRLIVEAKLMQADAIECELDYLKELITAVEEEFNTKSARYNKVADELMKEADKLDKLIHGKS